MLSKEKSDLLTQTGPGTPGGRFLRSYWQPIAASEEMPIGGDPIPIRIMSEDLVLFRDPNDELGLIGKHCPHRGTDLSYGRVEDGGIRCLYHGWLFDKNGNCIDQPAEPPGRKFCDKIKHPAYPVQEKGGAIWTYMGEGEPPLIPDFEFLMAPEPNRLAYRVIQNCNWLQGLESVLDPVHTTYLHRKPPGSRSIRSGNDIRALRGTAPPDISTEDASYGTRIYALHRSDDGRRYLRVNNYVYPCGATPSTSTGEAGYQGRWYVPIDDYSHTGFEFFYRRSEPLDKKVLGDFRADNVAQDNRHVRRPENRYLQDRDVQKRDESFTGMGDYFPAQDAFAIETQGETRDRTTEHLGSTDIVIAAVTRRLLSAIEAMEAGDAAPGQIRDPKNTNFSDFICTSIHIEEHEDGPSFCKRVLGEQTAAE
ncbi:MAG: Rieske 2Fe-2S domain-containing protein [Rhodospirillales bacterium]|jgi:phthalate 4,5-dioxygenase|nr:Rieske 2Fe-2S domain-containing protein [Rhodospirillales bacterium]MBT4006418.1 Rieske 2Fe-2S domain-containing protein [Rhodospirillales bacterium]MBT5114295.1 Rieske 2Fe-2S domain-containing protein [Rhodospirillales bacterium]MBT5673165.1 Rieske 2Fe-2S domain-containing protein [Rhodospirillales bacterium]MBT6186670.1 Rieske 2Fe-2S domain-containing protein [Rhodospirillales bacterium]